MNLIKVFEQTNFQEKGSFYKILNYLIEHSISKEIDELLSSNSSADINKFENDNIVKLFTLLNEDYYQFLQTELGSNISQLDIFIDILIRDGNAIINSTWFEELYKKQLKKLKNDGEKFIEILDSESKDIDEQRRRDYNIYRECVKVA